MPPISGDFPFEPIQEVVELDESDWVEEHAWIASYAPSWLPEDYVLRVWVNLGLDAITLASLFVLGGDFWDKVRALFLHDARAAFSS
jgi:hypothetical protein